MTSTLLQRRRPAHGDVVARQPERPMAARRDPAGGLSGWLRSDGTPAQFTRFVLVGGSTTAVYALLFLALGELVGLDYMLAHVASILASTVLANEMHRRLTFHADDRVGWFAAQWEAGGVSLIGLFATSTALGWLDVATGTADHTVQIAVVVAVTALIGALRFVVLRWIFRVRTPDDA